MVDLIPMTPKEFVGYRRRAVENYAAENVRAGRVRPEESADDAERAFSELLTEGVETPDHFLYVACEGNERVGSVWISNRRSEGVVWIYDIFVHEDFRRRGYGLQILRAVEEKARELSVERVGLHVFGHNSGARKLYERAGYETTSVVMTRNLRA